MFFGGRGPKRILATGAYNPVSSLEGTVLKVVKESYTQVALLLRYPIL